MIRVALVIALAACGDRAVSKVVPDDPAATLALGRAALRDQPRDLPRARAYFTRASQDGSAAAAYYLGVLADGDPSERVRWLTIAAGRGEPHAMFLLGNAYRGGAGVPRDDARALAYYSQAAEAELPAALQTLAMAYRAGELGLAPDEDLARRYEMEAGHALAHPPAEP